MTDTTISPYGRDACPVCGRDIALKKNGRMRVHDQGRVPGARYAAARCLGTNAKPAPAGASGGEQR